MPEIEVLVVPSTDTPGGIGEAGSACSTPALTDAVFAAAGKRVLRLPSGDPLKRA
jgi:CO/xanthine dehydrogenase Mo-binding subunit